MTERSGIRQQRWRGCSPLWVHHRSIHARSDLNRKQSSRVKESSRKGGPHSVTILSSGSAAAKTTAGAERQGEQAGRGVIYAASIRDPPGNGKCPDPRLDIYFGTACTRPGFYSLSRSSGSERGTMTVRRVCRTVLNDGSSSDGACLRGAMRRQAAAGRRGFDLTRRGLRWRIHSARRRARPRRRAV